MDNNVINDIRKSVDIVDIISRYVPLVSRGKNYFGVCPFHDDHSPSMSVSKDKQIYKCFSCGATGNVFNFIQDYENVSFKECLNILASIAGITISGLDTSNFKPEVNNSLYDIYSISSKLYINNLNTNYGVSAKKYLYDRDISDELIKEFEIGLSLKDRQLLTKLLVKRGFSNQDMLNSGLVIKNEYGYSDIYCNRIMFPLYDISGRIVGYSGRIYNTNDNSKYINTRETEIFKKGEILYNFHRAKESCRKKDTVIITEGFMDVIRCYSIGVQNVVACMGTAFTKEHVMLIRKLAKNVILCFDGDSAGRKATDSCIDILLEYNIKPKVVCLPDGLDPDEYIRKFGKDRFLSLVDNPINVMDFKLSYLKTNKDFSSSVDVASYVNSVISELNKIDDEVLRELTIRKISEESKLDVEFLKSKLNDIEEKTPVVFKTKVETNLSKYDKAQMYLIYYMFNNNNVVELYDDKVTFMPNEKYRKLACYISCFYKEYGYVNIADLITYLSNYEDIGNALNEIINLDLKDEFSLSEINDYIFVIKSYNINNEIKKLQLEQKKETDICNKAKIAQRIVELRKMEQEERYYD